MWINFIKFNISISLKLCASFYMNVKISNISQEEKVGALPQMELNPHHSKQKTQPDKCAVWAIWDAFASAKMK